MRKLFVQNIQIANKKEKADLVIKNANIVNVFSHEITEGDIAIANGKIVGIGEYEGKEEYDVQGKYVCPGFIDAHVHIESSMIVPSEFAKVVLPHGVTTVITDPHEIANVCGVEGIQFMIDASEGIPLDVFIMLPSCVPATEFENAGATILAEDLAPLFAHPRVLGLAEVMDFPAVLHTKEEMMNKLLLAHEHGGMIDGHAAGLTVEELNVYRTAGIRTDHECVTAEELVERVRRGMHVIVREGSVAKNLDALLQGVNERNARYCMFGTDDKHLDDLYEDGSINYHVRETIKYGLHPITAIQMATINAAECYGLKGKGAIAPGFDADLLILDDLESVSISKVYKSGMCVAESGNIAINIENTHMNESIMNTVHVHDISKEQLQIRMNDTNEAHVIGIIPNNLVTEHLVEQVEVENGYFIPSLEKDQLKMAVVERHKLTGNIGLGIVKGLNMRSGAIAATVAHDSHNIVVAGTNDNDMLVAIQAMKNIQGGIVVVNNGELLAVSSLPIGGLMSTKTSKEVYEEIMKLNKALQTIRQDDSFNAFLTLSFLSLPVIPKLKLTDKGLFNVETFNHINVACKEAAVMN
ncbi:adenine deaminase [Priestia taiwanensis]|uniref:Adenine deaminase n=1 Tax=Priestia taiwanensis TaxID=1347902 RepID=A0A917ALH5_9BACI|nr:adenine deaminase [Priestia taiwanensis]MBM7362133.1 adenine deaminase [Priestia taiwanensis]GGE59721.1 adenine deaminase [Priestia taiwanensis]